MVYWKEKIRRNDILRKSLLYRPHQNMICAVGQEFSTILYMVSLTQEFFQWHIAVYFDFLPENTWNYITYQVVMRRGFRRETRVNHNKQCWHFAVSLHNFHSKILVDLPYCMVKIYLEGYQAPVWFLSDEVCSVPLLMMPGLFRACWWCRVRVAENSCAFALLLLLHVLCCVVLKHFSVPGQNTLGLLSTPWMTV